MRLRIQKNKKGVTLIEIVTVLAILGVLLGVFYTVFITNWSAFDDRIARSHMWSQANEIVERVTDDARLSEDIAVATDVNGNKSATLTDTAGQIITYTIANNGQFQRDVNGDVQILSDQLDAVLSDFTLQGDGLRFRLALQEELFQRTVGFQTSTEVYPRN